jgi:ribonuclease Z
MIDVCLLGCGGMMPLPDRSLSALLCRINGRSVLIDCGEGTQVAIRKAGWRFKSIDVICFTHYHADHIAGLPGLLLTIGNSGRSEPITILGPPGLRDVIKGLTVITPLLPFELALIESPVDALSQYQFGELLIKAVPCDHGVPCMAYSLEAERAGKFDAGKAKSLGIPVALWNRLQNGETVQHDGNTYEPDMVLGAPRKGLKVTYCTDTRPTQALSVFCRDSDLLICEGIYGEDEKLAGAVEKKHMVFSEAALLARSSGSSELWLTHYSPSLTEPNEYIGSAKSIFSNSIAGCDLMAKTLSFETTD